MNYSDAKQIWDNKSPTLDQDGQYQYSESELAALEYLQEVDSRIQELQGLLLKTDYKDLPNYVPKNGEDISQVIQERNQWREEVRQLLLEKGQE